MRVKNKLHKKILSYFLLVFIGLMVNNIAFSQIGGYGVYKSLLLSSTPRTVALGGVNIHIRDNDPTSGWQNPACLNETMSGKLSMNYNNYIAGIGYGTFGYVHHIKKIGTLQAGIQYVNYGTEIAADPYGAIYGNWSASEYTYMAGLGRSYKRLSYGLNLKFILSQLSSWRSSGMAVDLGIHYRTKDSTVTYAFVLRNFGTQLTTYANTYEVLPHTIDATIAYKPKHAPFRFHVNYHDIQKFDLTYFNPNQNFSKDFNTGQNIIDKITFGEKLGRHLIVGGELLAGKGFKIQLAYNYQMRQELSFPQSRGFTGFSYGAGLKIRTLTFNYAHTSISKAADADIFGIYLDLGKIFNYNKTLGNDGVHL